MIAAAITAHANRTLFVNGESAIGKESLVSCVLIGIVDDGPASQATDRPSPFSSFYMFAPHDWLGRGIEPSTLDAETRIPNSGQRQY